MSYSIIKEIHSLAEYIDYLCAYKKSKGCELWYRGQRDNTWSLEPSIFRDEKANPNKPGEIEKLRCTNIPDFSAELNSFISKMKGIVPPEFNKFHMMMLGQHYGLKTPALDWTTDPLVALFFALDKYDGSNKEYPVIFILNPGLLNSLSIHEGPDKQRITQPVIIDELSNSKFDSWLSDLNNTAFPLVPFAIKSNLDISHRISRQSGVFTLSDARHLQRSYPWIQTTIEGVPCGVTLKIDPSCVDMIKEQLVALNITQETLYGSAHKEWDKLCMEINQETPLI